jgi:hypothetical protein
MFVLAGTQYHGGFTRLVLRRVMFVRTAYGFNRKRHMLVVICRCQCCSVVSVLSGAFGFLSNVCRNNGRFMDCSMNTFAEVFHPVSRRRRNISVHGLS